MIASHSARTDPAEGQATTRHLHHHSVERHPARRHPLAQTAAFAFVAEIIECQRPVGGEQRIGVLALITRQYRQMLYAKDMQESRTPQAQMAKALGVKPDAVAGHSLGEFSALVVAGALSFEDGLRLVSKRAMAMQKACEAVPGTMAAILGLDDAKVEEACASIDGVVVAANYNCPGQLVISGSVEAVDAACAKLKEAGAKRALRLPVGGAFHSPLMEPAKVELEKAINEAPFQAPVCPIYQNVDAKPQTDPATIKANLIAQLTAPVRWTYIVKNMLADGVTEFTELGPGNVLQGLIKKVNPEAVVESKSTL